METKKAGLILVNKEKSCIGLVYREKLRDYSFPKGHLEDGETLEECAVRETAEETKRDAQIVRSIDPMIERYVTPRGERCVCCFYVAIDVGHSDNDSTDVHELVWVDYDNVEEKLTYANQKEMWNKIKDKIVEL